MPSAVLLAVLCAAPLRALGPVRPEAAALQALRLKVEALRPAAMTSAVVDPEAGCVGVFALSGHERLVRETLRAKLPAQEYGLLRFAPQAPPAVIPGAGRGHGEDIAKGAILAGELMRDISGHQVFQVAAAEAGVMPQAAPAPPAAPTPIRRIHNSPPSPEELARRAEQDKIDWEKVGDAMRAGTPEGNNFKSWAGVGGTGVVTIIIGVAAGLLGIGLGPILIVGGLLVAAGAYGHAFKIARKITKEEKTRP